MPKPKPSYPIKDIKNLLRINHFWVNQDALQDAHNDFGWGRPEIAKCLLRLNDRYYRDDRSRNHFYKTKPHKGYPNTMMDYYKIKNASEGNKVYTHLYIHPNSGRLIISSFKEL